MCENREAVGFKKNAISEDLSKRRDNEVLGYVRNIDEVGSFREAGEDYQTNEVNKEEIFPNDTDNELLNEKVRGCILITDSVDAENSVNSQDVSINTIRGKLFEFLQGQSCSKIKISFALIKHCYEFLREVEEALTQERDLIRSFINKKLRDCYKEEDIESFLKVVITKLTSVENFFKTAEEVKSFLNVLKSSIITNESKISSFYDSLGKSRIEESFTREKQLNVPVVFLEEENVEVNLNEDNEDNVAIEVCDDEKDAAIKQKLISKKRQRKKKKRINQNQAELLDSESSFGDNYKNKSDIFFDEEIECCYNKGIRNTHHTGHMTKFRLMIKKLRGVSRFSKTIYYKKDGCQFTYKYPRFCHNGDFIRKLKDYIVHEIKTKVLENPGKTNTFYVTYERGELEIVDKNTYKEFESKKKREAQDDSDLNDF